MRSALVETLIELATVDDRVVLLTADLGWSVLERFASAFPDRFYNVGVAEQNMIGVATGLALEGAVPFAYTIATFATMRAFEQFRHGPALHGLPVRLVGVGGGFSYGHAGPSHHAIEDLCLMRALAGVTVIAPAVPPRPGPPFARHLLSPDQLTYGSTRTRKRRSRGCPAGSLSTGRSSSALVMTCCFWRPAQSARKRSRPGLGSRNGACRPQLRWSRTCRSWRDHS
jgi:transketolase